LGELVFPLLLLVGLDQLELFPLASTKSLLFREFILGLVGFGGLDAWHGTLTWVVGLKH